MNYSLIDTADGSQSYFNENFSEAYHSKHGAYSEALEKHVLACKIPELAKKTLDSNLNSLTIRILDVCFGLGYNSGVAIEKILEINPQAHIEIIGLENDPHIISLISKLKTPKHYENIHQTILSKVSSKLEYQSKQINVRILIGDARTRILELAEDYFDAVFFDPFSPAKCPELWDYNFINNVVRCARQGAYISTYSSARIAKDNFARAGCSIEEGPKLGRRNGGVLARRACLGSPIAALCSPSRSSLTG